METIILAFFNQSLGYPLLDQMVLLLTAAGLVLLPGLGLVLFKSQKQSRVGWAILMALAASLVLTLCFQLLARRARPEDVRVVQGGFSLLAFPSGYTAMAFSTAMIIVLAYRRWLWSLAAVAVAILLGVSRIYLGLHYPTDILGGAVLGCAVGAGSYGVFVKSPPQWRWLLWPQVAVVILSTQMAYLNILPFYLLQWPYADKVLHFLLFGAVVFWLNLWLNGRIVRVWWWSVPLAILLALSIASLEEVAQGFSSLRTADITDFASDLAGMTFFWWLSTRLLNFVGPSRPPLYDASSK